MFYELYDNMVFNIIILISVEVVLSLLSAYFAITRLIKVFMGFSELVSIFIQMDNKDIKNILKFTKYIHTLFEYLNEKHTKMTNHIELSGSSSSSNIKDL